MIGLMEMLVEGLKNIWCGEKAAGSNGTFLLTV